MFLPDVCEAARVAQQKTTAYIPGTWSRLPFRDSSAVRRLLGGAVAPGAQARERILTDDFWISVPVRPPNIVPAQVHLPGGADQGSLRRLSFAHGLDRCPHSTSPPTCTVPGSISSGEIPCANTLEVHTINDASGRCKQVNVNFGPHHFLEIVQSGTQVTFSGRCNPSRHPGRRFQCSERTGAVRRGDRASHPKTGLTKVRTDDETAGSGCDCFRCLK